MDANRFYGPAGVCDRRGQRDARVFDSNLSYSKGGYVPQYAAARARDSTFFRVMRRYRQDMQYRSATTEDFRASVEGRAGPQPVGVLPAVDLRRHFPRYRASVGGAAAGGFDDRHAAPDAVVTAVHDARGPHGDVRRGEQTFVAQDLLASQTFVFHARRSVRRRRGPRRLDPSQRRLIRGSADVRTLGKMLVNGGTGRATAPRSRAALHPTRRSGRLRDRLLGHVRRAPLSVTR